jgi:hypothetical protein
MATAFKKLVGALVLSFSVLILGCPIQPQSPSPHPVIPPDSDLCAAMCNHIGPKGLWCEEGNAVYDSDLPGPPDVPNLTCETWCKNEQANGVFINPRCVAQVKSCSEIEVARQKDCSTK